MPAKNLMPSSFLDDGLWFESFLGYIIRWLRVLQLHP
jgi:hypothetical protein